MTNKEMQSALAVFASLLNTSGTKGKKAKVLVAKVVKAPWDAQKGAEAKSKLEVGKTYMALYTSTDTEKAKKSGPKPMHFKVEAFQTIEGKGDYAKVSFPNSKRYPFPARLDRLDNIVAV